MKSKLITPIILLLFNNLLISQTIEWQKTFGGFGNDTAYSLEETSDLGYIIVGAGEAFVFETGDSIPSNGGSDVWIIKLDQLGDIEWRRNFGGTNYERASSVQQTSDEGFIVVGESRSNNIDLSGNNGGSDIWILKLNTVGEIEWERNFGGTSYDSAASVKQTSDQGYIIAGTSESNDIDLSGNNGDSDIWVLKLGMDGEIEWQKNFGGSSYDLAASVIQTLDQGYIIVGTSESDDIDLSGNNGNEDIWVLKLGMDGEIEWQKNFGGSSYDLGVSVLQTSDQGYVILGSTSSTDGDIQENNGFLDFWLVKINEEGILEWEQTLGGNLYDYASSIYQTSDQGFIVVGSSSSTEGDVQGNNGDYDFWVAKTNALGVLEWEKNLGGSEIDFPRSVQQTADQKYIIVGSSNSMDADLNENYGNGDFWIVKLSPTTTSLNEIGLSKHFNLSPNPSIGNFSISIEDSNLNFPLIIRVTDFLGRHILIQTINNSAKVEFYGMLKGVYNVSLSNQYFIESKTLIVH